MSSLCCIYNLLSPSSSPSFNFSCLAQLPSASRRTAPRPSLAYISCLTPWNGENIPLTDSFTLATGLFIFLSFNPLLFLSRFAFSRICWCWRFLTQMTFSRPLMYTPRMMGCLCGRGETTISIWGLALAKLGRLCERKALWGGGLAIDFFLSYLRSEVLHSSTGTCPVAVIEFKTLALENEPCESVLRFGNGAQALHRHGGHLRGGGLRRKETRIKMGK